VGSGGTVPGILNLSNILRWLVRFTL